MVLITPSKFRSRVQVLAFGLAAAGRLRTRGPGHLDCILVSQHGMLASLSTFSFNFPEWLFCALMP